jgi:8-oxo-dGTP diphosphatase
MDTLAYTRSLPKKRLAAGALLLNRQRDVLLVKPIYRTGWLIPGGAVETNESPRAGCRREVAEELGLNIAIGRLLTLDYQLPQTERTECLHFIFAGPVLTPQLIAQITLPANELSAYQFAPLAEAIHLLNTQLARRVQLAYQAHEQQGTIYAEDGQTIL